MPVLNFATISPTKRKILETSLIKRKPANYDY